jgi:hypothetical protein
LLDAFSGDNGMFPNGDLIMDASGTLYGTTQNGGPTNSGTVVNPLPVPEPSNFALLTSAEYCSAFGGASRRGQRALRTEGHAATFGQRRIANSKGQEMLIERGRRPVLLWFLVMGAQDEPS